MSIGQTIKLYRKEKKLTQSELAELIGVSAQAISKWETDTGMPDISQIVPLARVLEISTDKLLGYNDEAAEAEARAIRDAVCGRINFIYGAEYAGKLYNISSAFFEKHPDVPDIALIALESYIELVAQKEVDKPSKEISDICERYAASIFRYETNADCICKAYCLMSRVYDLLGENSKSESMLSRLPAIFGDRVYWEAEIAYANEKYDLALQKIKESFTVKARFIPRCIRLATRIMSKTTESEKERIKKSAELGEYMLRIINAFLSGGDYIP